MSTVIHCPECGGVVGATKTTEDGPPCHCTAKPAHPASGEATHQRQKPKKTCVKCGKDLARQKRLRDSYGYWCVDCHKQDKQEKEEPGIPCPECGRKVKPETLMELDGRSMCSRCYRAAKDLLKPGSGKIRQLDDTHFQKHEKTRLLVMIVIVVILAGFALYGAFQ